MGIRSNIINFIKKKIPVFDDSIGVFFHGEDNSYSDTTDYLTDNSVTASSCERNLVSIITGEWVGDVQVNDDENINEFAHEVAKSLARHQGIDIHYNFGIVDNKYRPISAEVLPFANCKVGKKDDNEYNGKIVVSYDWTDEDKFKEFDVFNPSLATLQAQNDKFEGQIDYKRLSKRYIYPNATNHAVRNDCYSEIQAGVMKKNNLDKGFMGKVMFITPPFVDDTLQDDDKDKVTQKTERDKFNQNIKKFMGADNVGNVMHLEMALDGIEDFDKQFIVKHFKPEFDDKIVAHTETTVANNIRKAYYSVPAILVEENKAFLGNSGVAIEEAQKYYFNNTTQIRNSYVKIVNEVLKNLGKEATYKPMFDDEVATADVSEDIAKAQATLKGSVGGVQGILSIQESYSQEKTTFESALTILTEIYGFSVEVASDLLGKPKIEDESNNN